MAAAPSVLWCEKGDDTAVSIGENLCIHGHGRKTNLDYLFTWMVVGWASGGIKRVSGDEHERRMDDDGGGIGVLAGITSAVAVSIRNGCGYAAGSSLWRRFRLLPAALRRAVLRLFRAAFAAKTSPARSVLPPYLRHTLRATAASALLPPSATITAPPARRGHHRDISLKLAAMKHDVALLTRLRDGARWRGDILLSLSAAGGETRFYLA